MRDTLPRTAPHRYETGVINLDNLEGPGTHWVAYVKKGNICMYFDSYGDLRPPLEFVRYMQQQCDNKIRIEYNYDRVQRFTAKNCGHLCLKFLTTYIHRMFNKSS